MKKYIVTSISFCLFCIVLLQGCGNKSTLFTLDDVKGKYEIEYTINTPRAAVEILKSKNKINVVDLENVEGKSNSNMIITVVEQSDQWNVKIKTRTAIPSYSCEYLLDRFGEPVEEDYIVKKCGFNK